MWERQDEAPEWPGDVRFVNMMKTIAGVTKHSTQISYDHGPHLANRPPCLPAAQHKGRPLKGIRWKPPQPGPMQHFFGPQ